MSQPTDRSTKSVIGRSITVFGVSIAVRLVLGDIMLDRYVTGEVRRISPDAPIPILKFGSSRVVLGGAGNVATNVADLCARTILIGAIGSDDLGLTPPPAIGLRAVALPDRPTTVKTRFSSGAHQLLRLHEEITTPLDAAAADRILQVSTSSLTEADVMILSGYAKGVLTDYVLTQAIALARHAGKPIIADPKRADLAAYRGVSVLTPNELEAAQATGITMFDDASTVAAGRHALDASQADAVLIARSEKGPHADSLQP